MSKRKLKLGKRATRRCVRKWAERDTRDMVQDELSNSILCFFRYGNRIYSCRVSIWHHSFIHLNNFSESISKHCENERLRLGTKSLVDYHGNLPFGGFYWSETYFHCAVWIIWNVYYSFQHTTIQSECAQQEILPQNSHLKKASLTHRKSVDPILM